MTRALVVAALLALTGAAARAQAPAATEAPAPPELPVGVEVGLGFAGRCPAANFIPVAADLTNRGAPATVTFVLRTDDGGALLTLGPVDLAAGERRRLTGVIPAQAGTLVATVTTAAGEVAGQAVVHPDVASGRILVALDRRGATPADLSDLRTSEPDARGQPAEVRWAAPVVAQLEDLPATPLGWNGAGAVLLGDLDARAWPEPAARALAAWVVRGGNLIISVGPRASALRRSQLGVHLGPALDPLPDAAPDRDVAPAELAALLGQLAQLGRGGDPPEAPAVQAGAALARLLEPERASSDEVLLRCGGRPFVVRRRHGLGRVTLVGADLWAPPLLHSSLTPRLVEALIDDGPAHQPRAADLFGELKNVRQPARVGPAFALLILFALLAGPGIYFVLRGRRRGILLWAAIPALTLAFTAVVPLHRVWLRDAESTLVGVRLIEGRAGRPVAAEATDVLIFSGSLDPKTLEYAGRDVVAYGIVPQLRGRRDQPDLGAALGGGPDGAAFSLPIALWGTRYVAFEATGEAPAVTGSVALSFGGGELREDAGRDPEARLRMAWDGPSLRDAVVLFPGGGGGGMLHRVGDVAPGEKVDEPVQARSPQSIEGNDLATLLTKRLIEARYLRSVDRERRAWLLGQLDVRSPLKAAPNVRARSFTTLVALELDVVYADAIPFGVARAAREGATVAAVDSGVVERLVTTRLALPDGAGRRARSVRARLNGARPRTLARAQLDVLDAATGEWRRILPLPDEQDEPAGRRLDVDLGEPASLVSDQGELLFRQRLRRPRGDQDEAHLVQVDVAVDWETPSPAQPPPR